LLAGSLLAVERLFKIVTALVCGTVEMVDVSATKNEPMVEIDMKDPATADDLHCG
jgi:hypothetical protein